MRKTTVKIELETSKNIGPFPYELDIERFKPQAYIESGAEAIQGSDRSMGTEEVKLHGTWASMFAAMVELALKLKGVPYDYVQEDLLNKSPALLSYNPVHKKVPVLVHRGKPLAESLVILHYVDETWPEPRLLPADPYERARVRFWIDFFHQKSNQIY